MKKLLMNKLLTSILVLSAIASATAVAQMRTISQAHEVDPAELRLPASTTGNLAFKDCDDCDLTTLRVNARTRYEVSSEAVDLREARRALRQARRNADAPPVIVLHDLETDFATSVIIEL